jgi:hypothetical protein
MTEPRTPDDQPIDGGPAPVEPADAPPAPDAPIPPDAPSAAIAPDSSDSPTQAWPSLASPTPEPRSPEPAGAGGDPTSGPTAVPATSPFEPASSVPASHLATVGESGTFGAAATGGGNRTRLRWGLAALGIVIVAVASFAIVSLVGGRPSTSIAIGYMPTNTMSYEEVRLDLPGDQRTKLASFLKAFPGFSDQSAIEPKLNDVLDRIVRAASKDKQTWTADIQPWFGGQLAFGTGLPSASQLGVLNSTASDGLAVATVTDRAKAIAWVTKTGGDVGTSISRSTYGDADLLAPAEGGGSVAIAVNDKVMLAGSTAAVKAAIDGGGKGALDQNDDVKAALATLDKDYVIFSVTRTRALADAVVKQMAVTQPGVLDKTQVDETILGLVPAWQAMTGRFENDAIMTSSVSPSWAIGYDGKNRTSDVLGHAPAKSIVYLDSHDIGPALTAVLAKFRALPEAKPAFDQLDQALSLLGGFDAVLGWWGDTAFVVSPLDDGTIGAGLVIHPRDATAADRLFTTLNGYIALVGGSTGVATRTEDHNGTKITILDLSAVPGLGSGDLPPGYKPEFAWAVNKDVVVIGYASSFVKAVLDAGPGSSLADDARFKALLGRVGADNLGMSFVDIAAIRGLVEPLAQAAAPADAWAYYTREIQPYLKPLDAVITNVRKDGSSDRSTGVITAH